MRKLECIKLQLQTTFDDQATGPTMSQVEENEDLLKKIDEAIAAQQDIIKKFNSFEGNLADTIKLVLQIPSEVLVD